MWDFGTWLLFYVIIVSDANNESKALTSGTVEFASQQQCDRVGQLLHDQFNNRILNTRVSFLCVKK